MLKELKFVQGAVSKKEFIPAMTHFNIREGKVRAYNGVLALSSPVPFNIDCNPKAVDLVRAISKCEDQISLTMTPAGKLRIHSGEYRKFIDCVDGDMPHVGPEGEHVAIDGGKLLEACKTLARFIGNDASRPWTNGILLRGQSAFATNNVCLVEYWLGAPVPFEVNVPRAAIAEMLRVDEAPTHAQLDKSSVTFHYADERWIRTQLFSTEWPDLSKVLNHKCDPQPINEKLFEGLEKLKDSGDDIGRVYLKDGMLRTHLEDDVGASFTMSQLPGEGCYQIHMLNLLEGVATTADFNRYPEPCLFFGDQLRGAIIGMRM